MAANGSLTIGNPDRDLVEAGASDAVGVATATVMLTHPSDVSYSLVGYSQIDSSHWSREAAYGTAILDTDANTLTYALDNYRPATQLLRAGDAPTDAVTVSLADGSSAQAVFAISGRNDTPGLAASSGNTTGQLAVTDPDRLSTVLVSVQGGAFTYTPQPFRFTMDSFAVVRNGLTIFNDSFDGTALSSAYRLNGGTPSEAGGRLIFESAQGAPISGVGSVQPLSGFIDTYATNTTAGSTAGLRQATTFAVSGVFDLTLPAYPRQLYGIRLTDATASQSGNDIVELDVRQATDGTNRVELRGLDQITNQTVTLASVDLGTPVAGDQIALHLIHAAPNTDTVAATFEILRGGVTGPTQTLSAGATIFHGEDFTRAAIQAYGRVNTTSTFDGQYGTLTIDQGGNYTFAPNATAKALLAGQAATETFTVVATDEQGATATQPVVVTVKGTGGDTPTTSLATKGRVVDGYIAGATVFADANGNGVLDAGEVSTQTDGTGNYALNGGVGPLVAMGGTDTATGLANTLMLSAPAGATVITPLTTLVQGLGGTAAAAGKVASAFGLSSNINLNTFDPIAATASGSEDGRAAVLAGVAVADTAAVLSAALVGQGASTAAAQAAVTGQLTAVIASLGQGAILDLTSAAVLTEVVATAAAATGVTLNPQAASAVAGIAAVGNVTLLGTTLQGQELLNHAALNATAAQGSTSQSVTAAHGDAQTLQSNLAAVSSLSVTLTHDTGASGTDHITQDASVTVSGQEAQTMLAYTVDGKGVASYDPGTLGQGEHTVAVIQTDAAGNVSKAGLVSFTLDTMAPAAGLSGVSGEKNHTNGHVITGMLDKADAGLTMTLHDGATVLGTAVADQQGFFAFAFADTKDGPTHSYGLTASATDAAGNVGVSDAFVFAFDYTPNRELFGTVATGAGSHVGQTYALYEGLLDRDPDQGGAQNWVAALDQGRSLQSVTQGFLDSAEGRTHYAPGTSNADYVDQLYGTVLHRTSDSIGKAGWIAALDGGATRAEVADGFVFSEEHLGQLQGSYSAGVYVADPSETAVARLYYGLLDRAPDSGGLEAWSSAAKTGASITSIAQGFLNSSEYASSHVGLTDQQYVTELYADALNRSPDTMGEQNWLSALASGSTRAEVAVGIAESTEAQAHLAGKVEFGWHLA